MPADQMPSARHAASVVAILMVLAGGAALAYARWSAPIAEGDRAIADGQFDRALAAYARAEARFDRVAPARQLFPRAYARVVAAELGAHDRLRRYADATEK